MTAAKFRMVEAAEVRMAAGVTIMVEAAITAEPATTTEAVGMVGVEASTAVAAMAKEEVMAAVAEAEDIGDTHHVTSCIHPTPNSGSSGGIYRFQGEGQSPPAHLTLAHMGVS